MEIIHFLHYPTQPWLMMCILNFSVKCWLKSVSGLWAGWLRISMPRVISTWMSICAPAFSYLERNGACPISWHALPRTVVIKSKQLHCNTNHVLYGLHNQSDLITSKWCDYARVIFIITMTPLKTWLFQLSVTLTQFSVGSHRIRRYAPQENTTPQLYIR